MKRSILLTICLAAQFACSRAGGGTGNGETSTVQASAGEKPIVQAAVVSRESLSTSIVLTGEFQPYQEVDLMAKVAGYIREIPVDMGDRVHKGQVLATLEMPEMQNELTKAAAEVQQNDAMLAGARDELKSAQSAHEIAHLSFDRIGDVSKREPGLVPRQEVDEARSKDSMTDAQASGAKSNLDAAARRGEMVRAEQARLQTLFGYTRITAPFDGIVTKRFANVGSMIQAGTSSQSQAMPVVRLAQDNILRLILPVPESSVSRIRNGEAVSVRVPSLNRSFTGKVTRSSSEVRRDTRTMDTEVDMANPGFLLVPGMYAEVNLRTQEHQDALCVPVDAIETTNGSARVITIDSDGILRHRPVLTGLETAQRVEIVTGLNEGDRVVVGRHAGLQDGEHVQARLTTLAAAAGKP